MNVLAIPEDFRKDLFILKPVLRKMLAEAGSPKAKVQICMDPLLGGITEALKWERIEEVIDMHPMVQLFLLIVDRDGKPGRRCQLDRIEQHAKDKLESAGQSQTRKLLAENAWQEIEVWAIAGVDRLPKGWVWKDIRAEEHAKEIYFEKIAESRGLLDEPGQGRTTLGREAAQNYSRVRSRCPEDIKMLEEKIREWNTNK